MIEEVTLVEESLVEELDFGGDVGLTGWKCLWMKPFDTPCAWHEIGGM